MNDKIDFDSLFDIPIVFQARDGKDGINGKDGKDGRDGIDGKDGRDGIDGKDGINGKDGKNGRDGVDGKNGAKGAKGDRGEKGRDGISIDDAVVNESGELLILKSDGSELNAGNVRGKDGKQGYTWGYANFTATSPLIFPEPHDNLYLDTNELLSQLGLEPYSTAYRVVSESYEIIITDKTIVCTGAGGISITLIDPAMVAGREFDVKNMTSGIVTVLGDIDDDSSAVIYPGLVGNYPNLRLKSIDTGYIIL